MKYAPRVPQLAEEIRRLYQADPSAAPQAIAALLRTRLADRPVSDGKRAVQEVIGHFSPQRSPAEGNAESEVLIRVVELLLGRKVTPDDLSSEEMLQRLARSLNTIFNSLNQLIRVINATLSGGGDGEQTIRQFIGEHLEGEDRTQSLEAYLGRINDAFLASQEAFKKAVNAKVGQIMQAIDPEKVAAERSGGLKIGPLRKAEDFDILKEKIDRIKRWYDSGRFMEDFLREFEKHCQAFSRK
ncbi:MAG: hypothetical protein HZB24_08505 [Desulfobacterales bacterium]|nr:hypothetical protein [Desulfobacterales bacterium]